jgi:hypothetical protein
MIFQLKQQQQKNMMDQLGQQVQRFKQQDTILGGCGIQTACLAFGGQIHLHLQEQQKNIMDQLGQLVEV